MRKLLAMVLSGVLLLSSIPVYSLASETEAATPSAAASSDMAVTSIVKGEPTGTSGSSKLEPTSAQLEAAIKAIKKKITIPKSYSEFSYNFYDGGGSYAEGIWNLTWRNSSDSSYIQVNCDEKYRITYFSQYDPKINTTGVAKYLQTELKPIAHDFISTIAPETNYNLEFVSSNYEGIYSGNYVFYFQRRANDVSFPDNAVSVSVNSITGKVTSATLNWNYEASIPDSKVKLTKEEAIKLIKKNMNMRLVYRSNYYYTYDKIGNPTTNVKAYLVYEPTQNYISIDAKTGEVYLSRSEWVTTGTDDAKSESAASTSLDAGKGSTALTDAEIAKISELSKLITKAKAIEIVTSNSSLYLDKNLKSYTASLSKVEDSKNKTSYVWNVNLNDPREVKENDTYRAYAYASVDAQTGNILSFSASMNSYYDEKNNTWTEVKMNYNKEQSKAILENFLKTQMKDRFSKSVLAGEYDGYLAYYLKEVPVYGGYSFQYNRTNEGIEYPYNNISGAVDGVTGKIYSFGSYWNDEVVFESPKNVISADKAMDYYLSNDGFGLKYELNTINKHNTSYGENDSYYDSAQAYTVEYEVRLVYRPDVEPYFISPFTGEQLNYSGEVYKKIQSYSYKDISFSEKKNRNILLLADMNIGFEGEKFLPNQKITRGEFESLLQKVSYGYQSTTDADSNSKVTLTREVLANILIKRLGLEKVSKLKGIYATGYLDEKNISSGYLGSVALAKGLDLVTGVNNKFYPKNAVTREKAVEFIFKYITAVQDTDGINNLY
jgi:hypothetical protein